MNSEWKHKELVHIPTMKTSGFRERVIIRKYIESMVEPDEGTVIIKDRLKNDDATVLIQKKKVVGYIKRLKTKETTKITKPLFILGKGSYADYMIENNPTISRKHAQILQDNEKFYIEDLQSANHTFIDDKEIEGKTELHNESIFCLSNELFQLVITEEVI